MSQKKIKTSVIESKSFGLYEAFIFVTGVNPKISPPCIQLLWRGYPDFAQQQREGVGRLPL